MFTHKFNSSLIQTITRIAEWFSVYLNQPVQCTRYVEDPARLVYKVCCRPSPSSIQGMWQTQHVQCTRYVVDPARLVYKDCGRLSTSSVQGMWQTQPVQCTRYVVDQVRLVYKVCGRPSTSTLCIASSSKEDVDRQRTTLNTFNVRDAKSMGQLTI